MGEISTEHFKLNQSEQVVSKSNGLRLLDIHYMSKKIKDSNNIDYVSLLLVVLLSILGKALSKTYFSVLMFGETILSILILMVALQGVFRLAKGRLSIRKSINLSVYMHTGVVIANLCNDIPVVSVVTFIGAQLLGVYLQYIVGVQVAHAEIKILKNICLVQLLLILLSLVIQLMTSWGVYVAYSTKIYHFPLA